MTAIPWVNGERAEYRVHFTPNSGERLQVGEIAVEYRISEELEENHIALTTRTEVYNPNYMEEVTVISDTKNYRPRATHAIICRPGGETIQFMGEYKRRRVEISIDSTNGVSKTRIDVPSHVFDNYQAHFLMRALIGQHEGYSTSIHAVHVLQQLLIHPFLTVEGKDVVEVPAGSFLCWRIASTHTSGSEVRQCVLLSDQEPYPMVKNIKGPQSIELTDYCCP